MAGRPNDRHRLGVLAEGLCPEPRRPGLSRRWLRGGRSSERSSLFMSGGRRDGLMSGRPPERHQGPDRHSVAVHPAACARKRSLRPLSLDAHGRRVLLGLGQGRDRACCLELAMRNRLDLVRYASVARVLLAGAVVACVFGPATSSPRCRRYRRSSEGSA